MAETSTIDHKIAILPAMIDGPDVDLTAFLSDHPYLRMPREAREIWPV